MSQRILLTALMMAILPLRLLEAQNDGPLISITSPDNATTFAMGNIKNRSLNWSKKYQMLVVQITFTDTDAGVGQSNDDTHEFRLPGVTFDETKGLFFATSSKGEIIPVARIKKILFVKSIEILPNANIRIQRMRGNVTVILEAISPNDPAMRASPPNTNSDGTQTIDLHKIL